MPLETLNAKLLINEENLSEQEILQISAIDIFIFENKLICTIEIPLVDHKEYILYKLYPLPKMQDSNSEETIFSFISPENDYVALSQDRNYFSMLSQNMIQSCKKIKTTYICSDYPPFEETRYTYKCEPKIAANLQLRTKECNTKLFKSSNTYWIKLTNNTWAYSAPKPDKLSIKCQDNIMIPVTIKNCGIIHIEPDCIVNSKTIQFSSNRHYSNYGELQNYTALWSDITESINKDLKQYKNNSWKDLFTEELVPFNK